MTSLQCNVLKIHHLPCKNSNGMTHQGFRSQEMMRKRMTLDNNPRYNTLTWPARKWIELIWMAHYVIDKAVQKSHRHHDSDIIVMTSQITGKSTVFKSSQIAKFIGPTWGPPGPCRPHMGPMLSSWTLLSWLFQAKNKCNTKALHYWPLVRETTDNQWILNRKGQ